MATSNYIKGRWNLKYDEQGRILKGATLSRPQAIAWSNNYGTLDEQLYVPDGTEWNDFIILSDHNRQEISITCERIENRKRMIDGKMRSYHVVDKHNYSWSWERLPSRAYNKSPEYNANGKISNDALAYTYDGGAGGVELVDWYENHNGPFYMLLSYDKYNNFPAGSAQYFHLSQYNEVKLVYFSSFEKGIEKRAGLNFDFWNISVQLEEV